MMNICNYVRGDYLVCRLFCRHDWLRMKLLRRHSVDTDWVGLGMSIRTVCNVPEQVMWCQVGCIFYCVSHSHNVHGVIHCTYRGIWLILLTFLCLLGKWATVVCNCKIISTYYFLLGLRS